MQFGRELKTKTEKDFKAECYKIGMANGWCSGEYELADGGFITEEDCLNENRFFAIDDLRELERFFKNGNWCLGEAVIFGDLCFINQINGGDEWLTIKKFPSGEIKAFESISFIPFVERSEFKALVEKLQKAKSVKDYFA